MSELIKLVELHPTQITLGLREVARRQARIAGLNSAAQKSYIEERVVPCVRGPGRTIYLIDRHHMCRALLGAGLDAVHHNVICDVSGLGIEEFWRFMDLRRWVHPFDQVGRRCDVTAIPKSIVRMVDDPYRALAGVVRRENGFEKDDSPFEEFIWADFLRHRISSELVRVDFEECCAQALKLARSEQARHLPGWNGSR